MPVFLLSTKSSCGASVISNTLSIACDLIGSVVRPNKIVFNLLKLAINDAHLHAANVFVVKAEFFRE